MPRQKPNKDLWADIDVYISNEDGAFVIHVDTPGIPDNALGPKCRIYLNDDIADPIWDNTEDNPHY